MAFQIDIVSEGSQFDSKYDAFLDTCRYSFVQQSTVWREVIKDLGPDEPYLLLAEEDGVPVGALPLYLYRGRFGNIMTSVPQPGPHGGIAFRDEHPDKRSVYKKLIDYALALSREKGCCLFSVITNPIDPDDALYREILLPEYELENFTQYIMLKEVFDEEGVPSYMKKRNIVKRKIEKVRMSDIEIKESASREVFDCWYGIHEKRHGELGVTPLEKRLFDGILTSAVPVDRAKFLTAWYTNKLVGGCFYIYNQNICDAFLMSSDSEYIDLGINYALTDTFLRWSHGQGKEIFNWQSSPGRASGVYDFKKRMGSKEAVYFYLSKVIGDISRIMNGDYHEIRHAYKNHFLLPLEGLGQTDGKKFGDFVKKKVIKQ
ncbi:MAG: hypothetical protein HZA17_03530 [Nitrospirae bacterium]|nr:hypothetical protein [Nitrospirota bacterium]